MLEGSGWLPEPLRTADVQGDEMNTEPAGEALPAFVEGDDEQVQALGEEDDSEPRPAHQQAVE